MNEDIEIKDSSITETEQYQTIHYDVVQIINSWDIPIEDKVNKLINYIYPVLKPQGINIENIDIAVKDNNISSITINKTISSLFVEMSMDENGFINLKSNLN